MKPTKKRSALSTAIAIALAACAASAGCSTTVHRHEARPVSATLEIRVEGQWRSLQRVTYRYEAPMPSHLESLPVAELERMLRELESAGNFGPDTTALRVLIECKRAGLKIKEE
jgi:hypothetical protein